MLPVVMITASIRRRAGEGDRGGADDFRPSRSTSRNCLHEFARFSELGTRTIRSQAAQLKEWNERLEERVREQVAQPDRPRPRAFRRSWPEAIVSGGAESFAPPA
jgi:hypothetical protein